jgi:tetratricopeptide (TPR) repeat protein
LRAQRGGATVNARDLSALLRNPAPDRPQWLVDVARLEIQSGLLDAGFERLGYAIAHAFRRNDVDVLSEAWRVQVEALLNQGKYAPARELVVQLEWLAAGKDSGILHARHIESQGLIYQKTGSYATGEFVRGIECYARALALYGEARDTYGRLRAYEGLASAYAGAGRYNDAVAHIDAGLKLSSEANDWRMAHRLLADRAFTLRDQGYRHSAWDGFELAIAWCEETGDGLACARTLWGLGVLLGYRIDLTNLETHRPAMTVLDRALDLALAHRASPLAMEIHLARAEIYEVIGDPDGARNAREAAGQVVDPLTAEGGQALVAQRDLERATIDQARRLREEQRIREAIESSPDAFFIFDACRHPDGTLTDLLNEFRNSAADTLLDLAPHIVRLLSEMAFHPCLKDLPKVLANVANDRVRFEDVIEVVGEAGSLTKYARRAVPAGDGVALTLRNLGPFADQNAMPS